MAGRQVCKRHAAAAMTVWRLVLLLAAVWLPPALGEESELRLATTTSLENSGLLGHLLPAFERQCGCRVRVIPVGTGKALELGRRGDVDILLVHAPAAEAQFIADGYGVDRRPIAYNYFLLLMPPQDPAGVSGETDLLAALRAIAERQALFLSRGDDSGTHRKELALWRQVQARGGAAVVRERPWYIEAGIGMGQAIMMADQLGAYVLSDTGTYLYVRDKVQLAPLQLPETPLLYNPYSVIRVSDRRHPHTQTRLARQLADWLRHPDTRRRIADYRLFGNPLFIPAE